MAKKNLISEERLQQLIQESIYEVLAEGQYDEGFGHWLGKTFQGLRNKWNNFKGDFKAGQHKARWDNRDYDPFSEFGDEADDIRNFGGNEYGAYRYNLTTQRNQSARQWGTDRIGKTQNTTTPQITPHPDLGGTAPAQSGATTPQDGTAPAQGGADTPQNGTAPVQGGETTPQNGTEPAQGGATTPNGGATRKYTSDNETTIKRRALVQAMTAAGMVPVGNPNKPTDWKNGKGGKLTHEQDALRQQWKRYKTYQEQLEKLQNVLNEVRNRKNKK